MRVDPLVPSEPAVTSNNISFSLSPCVCCRERLLAGWPPGGCMVVLDFSVYSDCDEDLVGNRPFKYAQLFSFHFRTSL